MNSIGNPISLIRQRLISLLPPRIDTLAYCLDTFKWTWTAMLMVKMYFRDQYDAYTASLTSPLTYRQAITGFYKLVEANDWFKVDWSLLESALEVYEDTGNIRYLHIPIYHIPVETYGQLRTDDSELARPIRTLENLLLDKSTRLVVWGRLKHIWQNPSQYPPSITQLPDMALWATYQLDNMILCLNQLELREFPTWPMWYCDLYKIKQDWKQAKPILEVVHRLREWGRTPENMQKLNQFLKTGEGVNELNY